MYTGIGGMFVICLSKGGFHLNETPTVNMGSMGTENPHSDHLFLINDHSLTLQLTNKKL